MENLKNKKFYIIIISFVVVIIALSGLLIYKGINKDTSNGEKHSEEYLYYNERFYLDLIKKEEDKYYIITRVKSEHVKDNEIVVPDTIDGIPVRKIISDKKSIYDSVSDFGTFDSWKNITTIKIGKNIEYIGTERNNDGILKGGTLGDSFLTAINSKTAAIIVDENNLVYASANGVLYNKDYTVLIRYPNNKIEDYSSFVCEIPETVTKIYNKAFYINEKIKTLKLNDNLIEIGNAAFYGCSNLSTIHFNNQLQTIGNEAFKKCALTSVDLPSTLISLGNTAFFGNKLLQRANIVSEIQNVGKNIFEDCSSRFEIWTTELYLTHLETIDNFNEYTIKSE